MFEIVIVVEDTFPAASVAVNVTVPLLEKVAVEAEIAFTIPATVEVPTIVPSFVVAVTATFRFVEVVAYGSIVIFGATLSMFDIVTVFVDCLCRLSFQCLINQTKGVSADHA